MAYTEFTTAEKPIIEMLGKLGWEYVPSSELDRDFEEPFDRIVTSGGAQRIKHQRIKKYGEHSKIRAVIREER